MEKPCCSIGKIIKEDGAEPGPEEVGELFIKGHTFESYWKNPEATEETMSAGWLKTGDLAKEIMTATIILSVEKRIL